MMTDTPDSAAEEQRLEDFSRHCREAGIRLTHQRREVFREIIRSMDHPTVDVIYERVRKRLQSISRDTVYRTLWTLREMSLITTVGYPYRSVHFDGNDQRHDHFLCTRCGEIIDLANPVELKAPAEMDALGRIESTYVEYRGLCRQCIEGNAPMEAVEENDQEYEDGPDLPVDGFAWQ